MQIIESLLPLNYYPELAGLITNSTMMTIMMEVRTMIKDQIVNPFLIEEDVVSIALMDDPLFEQDLMNANLDQSDEKEFEMAESIIPDSDEFDSPLLDDSLS